MTRAPQKSDSAIDRLLKLLPAESTGAFLILRSQFPYDSKTSDFVESSISFYLLSGLILIATPFLLSRIWGEKNKFVIGFITVSFIIWALNIDIARTIHLSETLKLTGVPMLGYILNDKFISGLMVVWAIVLVPLALPPKDRSAGDADNHQGDEK